MEDMKSKLKIRVPKQTVCKPTRRNIERQDFVDGAIFELINELLPENKQIDWDIEVIAEVRDSIFSAVSDKVEGLDEFKFYP